MSELDRMVNACLLGGFAGADLPGWVGEELAQGLAGVVLFPHNLDAPPNLDASQSADARHNLDAPVTVSAREAVARHARALRAVRADALVAVDEEGGDVTRLYHRDGSPYPGNFALGLVDDLDLTRRVAAAIATDLTAAGVNYNLAPSLDLATEPDNPVAGVRSFGGDPKLAAAHGVAYIHAMAEARVATAGKHFPGHGATLADSHREVPVVDADRETLYRRELPPFLAAIEAGVPSLMVGHVRYPALDPYWPATLSRTVLHDLVRDRLGYQGVLLSTAPALSGGGGPAALVAAAVRALRAGADLLLTGPLDGAGTCAAIRTAVAEAVRHGELDARALETAAARVDALRAWAAPQRVATAACGDSDAGLEAARRALRVRGDVGLPRPATVIELRSGDGTVVGDAYWSVADRLAERGLLARAVAVDPERSGDLPAAIDDLHPLVLVVRDAHRRTGQRDWVRALLARRPDAILVAVGLPEDAALTSGRSIGTAGAGRANTRAAAEALAGERHGGR